MNEVRIFVEGKEDKEFVLTILRQVLEIEFKDEFIINVGGWTNLPDVRNLFEQTTDIGGTNLIIFDADTDHNEGGFEKRSKQLQDKMSELDIDAEIFLFPDNREDGDFESLLEMIVNPTHKEIITRFSNYEECLKTLNKAGKNYRVPARKAKIYAYIDAFPHSGKIREKIKKGNYLYANEEYWNLNSVNLKPLIEFLEKYLKEN